MQSEQIKWVMAYFTDRYGADKGELEYLKYMKENKGLLASLIKSESFRLFMERRGASGIRLGIIKRLNVN